MRISPTTTAKLFLVALAVLLSSGSVHAVLEIRGPVPELFLEKEHRLRVEQGERASRELPASPRLDVAPNNGIEQLPIDTRRSGGISKMMARNGTPGFWSGPIRLHVLPHLTRRPPAS